MTDIHHDIGRLTAQVEALQDDVSRLNKLMEAQAAQMNRWRGAGAVLILIGAVLGWLVSLIMPGSFRL